MPRTTVVFRTTAFNTTTQKPYFLNPGCFGDDVSRWMIAALRQRGVKTAEEPGQEDFGWYMLFEVDGQEHCFVLGYRPGDTEHEGDCIGTLERSRGLVGSLLGRRQIGVNPKAVQLVHELVSGLPDVSDICWHHEKKFKAGIEDEGATTPGAG